MAALLLVAISAAAALIAGTPRVAEAGGGCHVAPSGSDRDASTDTVFMAGACFVPMVARVQPGVRVGFKNKDEMIHQVAGVGGEWGTDGRNLSQGDAVQVLFDKPGIYPYACMLHYGMVGVVVVGDGKFVTSLSGAIGSTIKTSQEVNAAAEPLAPAPATPAAVADSDDGRSAWLYTGLGALAGAAVVAVASGVWLARSK